MEIIKVNLRHPITEEFKRLCNITWPNYFEEDFPDDSLTLEDTEIYIVLQDSTVIGGTILNSKRFITPYPSIEKQKRRDDLGKKGYKGCSYFVIAQKYRKEGLGSKLLEHLQSKEDKIWLRTATPDLMPFYVQNGFMVDTPPNKEDPYPILTYTR